MESENDKAAKLSNPTLKLSAADIIIDLMLSGKISKLEGKQLLKAIGFYS